ncbi:hypothetical protein F4803DRAFT_524535 [Xylaria telfairii]|nr:hypothetical protein F4803DRAFT_524535 [Xylaria telfairii]
MHHGGFYLALLAIFVSCLAAKAPRYSTTYIKVCKGLGSSMQPPAQTRFRQDPYERMADLGSPRLDLALLGPVPT